MRRVMLMLLVLGLSGLLAGCGPGGRHDNIIPTPGPVRTGAGGQGTPSWNLVADTNCVDVGQVVTFTATLANQTEAPFTVSGTPLLDIVLKPTNPALATPVAEQRWSMTDQYPRVIAPVWAPGETRTYQWHWTADAGYAQQPHGSPGGVRVIFTTGDIQQRDGTTPAGGVEVLIGIGSLPTSPFGHTATCAEIRQHVGK